MKPIRIILVLFSVLMLSACGGSESSQQSSNEPDPTNTPNQGQNQGGGDSEDPINKGLSIGQNCDLSAYSTQPNQDRYDFKFSNNPVISIYKKKIHDFQLENFASLEEQNDYIQEMIDSNSITIRTEQSPTPICTISYAELKADVLAGTIPLDALLNQFCPTLTPSDLRADADTDKEKELLALLDSDYSPESVEEVFLSHHLILGDADIFAAGYMGFTFNIAKEGDHISYSPMARSLTYEEANGFMAVLNYTGTEQSRCEYAEAP
jgi:hypothetical protein